jgi:hypothetical protein
MAADTETRDVKTQEALAQLLADRASGHPPPHGVAPALYEFARAAARTGAWLALDVHAAVLLTILLTMPIPLAALQGLVPTGGPAGGAEDAVIGGLATLWQHVPPDVQARYPLDAITADLHNRIRSSAPGDPGGAAAGSGRNRPGGVAALPDPRGDTGGHPPPEAEAGAERPPRPRRSRPSIPDGEPVNLYRHSWEDPRVRARRVDAITRALRTPEARQRMSQAAKQRFQRPDERQRVDERLRRAREARARKRQGNGAARDGTAATDGADGQTRA